MVLHFLHFLKRLCPIRLSCSLIINVKFNGYLRFFYIKIALHAIKQKCFLCAFDTLNFKLWLKYAFILSDCRIFLLSISLAGISQCFRFLGFCFYLDVVRHAQPHPNFAGPVRGVSQWYEVYKQVSQFKMEVGQLPCSGFITTFFSQNPLYSFLGYCGQKSTQKQCFGAF